jgi:hypothetical protein
MSDHVQFKATLDVTAKNEEAVTEFCIAHLKERGYSVTQPHLKWETPKEMIARLRICYETLSRRARDPNRPNVAIHRGSSGRLIQICSNADFDAFCRMGCPKK